MSSRAAGGTIFRPTAVNLAASLYLNSKPPLHKTMSGTIGGGGYHQVDAFSNFNQNRLNSSRLRSFLFTTNTKGDPYASSIPLPATWEVSPEVASILGSLATFRRLGLSRTAEASIDIANTKRIIAACRAGDLARAQLFYRRLHCVPAVGTYVTMMNACAQHGLLGDAIVLYTDLLRLRRRPNAAVFLALLRACVVAGHAPRAVWVCREAASALAAARRAVSSGAETWPVDAPARPNTQGKGDKGGKGGKGDGGKGAKGDGGGKQKGKGGAPPKGGEKDGKPPADGAKLAPPAVGHTTTPSWMMPTASLLDNRGFYRVCAVALRFLMEMGHHAHPSAGRMSVDIIHLMSGNGTITSPWVHADDLQALRTRAAPGALSTHWLPDEWTDADRGSFTEFVNDALRSSATALAASIPMPKENVSFLRGGIGEAGETPNDGVFNRDAVASHSPLSMPHRTAPYAAAQEVGTYGGTYLRAIADGRQPSARGAPRRMKGDLWADFGGVHTVVSRNVDTPVLGAPVFAYVGQVRRESLTADPKTAAVEKYFEATGPSVPAWLTPALRPAR
eukprot:TRINITY_DN5567_c0_g1_i1.p1 TRINITY_DN5567_c0_g1~~TRINITY_DN5567_c0_g1_i1.p1  ORF type:complete len:587 (+),score=67.33 TRINITY_DN5567_c0_g1_i1:78-1763(+)